MIKLNLGYGEGNVRIFEFLTLAELCNFMQAFESHKCVWVVAANSEKGEILITETFRKMIQLISIDYFNTIHEKLIFIQEYPTYEDAYAVALDMREPNPMCYNKNNDYE